MLADEYVARLAENAETFRSATVGGNVALGPIIDAKQPGRFGGLVDPLGRAGARPWRAGDKAEGLLFPPTVLDRRHHDSPG